MAQPTESKLRATESKLQKLSCIPDPRGGQSLQYLLEGVVVLASTWVLAFVSGALVHWKKTDKKQKDCLLLFETNERASVLKHLLKVIKLRQPCYNSETKHVVLCPSQEFKQRHLRHFIPCVKIVWFIDHIKCNNGTNLLDLIYAKKLCLFYTNRSFRRKKNTVLLLYCLDGT